MESNIGNNVVHRRREPQRLYLVFGITALLTGLCAPPEREYSRQVIEYEGDVEVRFLDPKQAVWPAMEFDPPVSRAVLSYEDGRVLMIAQCNGSIDCVLGISALSCVGCYTDNPEDTCWQLPNSDQGTIDCTGKKEIDNDNEYDYRGEFTLVLETADGEVTTMTYVQDWMDPEPSCGY